MTAAFVTPTLPRVELQPIDWTFNPYDKLNVRGVTFDQITYAALLCAEASVPSDPGPWPIAQGSYHPGTDASGGTHDGGGELDADPTNAKRRVRALKDFGFAAWHRLAIPDLWEEHLHAGQIGNREASPTARAQWPLFLAGRDGLKSNLPDRTYRPDPPVRFTAATYREFVHAQRHLSARLDRTRKALETARSSLETAAANSDDKAQRQAIRDALRNVRGVPKR